MRKALWIIVSTLILCLCLSFAGHAEIPSVDLSTFSLEELNQVKADIASETKLHHETSAKVQEDVLKTVKAATEQYYSEKGITVSWAWYDWEYKYTRNFDFFTLTTHLDYEDSEKKGHKVDVSAELYYDGSAYHVYRLMLDKEQVYSSDYVLPANLLIDTGSVTVNEKTGINLSLLTASELKDFERFVQKEIDTNHNPRNSSRVNDTLKKTVEAHFSALGVKVDWPWFDYDYTCDWDCYTETTRISYELDGTKHRDERVYAEIFPDNGQYRVYYLVVGDNILINDLDSATDANALFFLRKRAYAEGVQLLSEENYEEAYAIFDKLGDFDNSLELRERCVDAVDQLRYEKAQSLMDSKKYEDAITIFESLGDYSDSSQKAAQCREAIKEIAYQNALALMNAGDFEQAIAGFTDISDYKDSQQKISECQAGITENEYNRAVEIMAEGKYAEAIAIFETLNGYSESEANILACQENINSQNYTQAEELYASGKYAEAMAAFSALGDYKDSKDRASQLQEIISSIDREITLAESEFFIFQGQKIVLEPAVSKTNQNAANETALVYTSSDQNIARVGKDGTVTAAKVGEATIRCEAADNPYVMVEATIHVVKNVNRIVLSSNKADLSIPEQNGNSSTQLTVSIEPEDAHIKTGVWSSNNEKVATVDQEGKITAVGVGRAVITFTSDDNSKGKKAATCNVNVVQAVTSLELTETSGIIYVGKPTQLKPTIEPKNAANKKLTWTSSNEEIATVNANGQIKGIKPGEVVITASSSDGPSVKYNATVKMPPVTLKVSGTAKCIAKNHVGNKWSKGFLLNGDDIKGTGKVTVENGDIITVGCWIEENDANPESDGFTEKIEITPEIMTKGLKIERTVYVTENGGRYSGYSAEWSVVITIKP